MPACGNWNALGDWDALAAGFTEDEIEHALDWRQKHAHMTARRQDYCPHEKSCESVTDCIERIAWYFRFRREIEARSA
jgi:hypothetical protein